MEDQREVTFQRALEFAKEYKLHKVFETSAKTGFNVEEVFAMVAKELYLQHKREQESQSAADAKKNAEASSGAGKGKQLDAKKSNGAK